MLKCSAAVVKSVETSLHFPPPCLCHPFIGCICVCLMKAVVWLQLNLKLTLSLERRSPVCGTRRGSSTSRRRPGASGLGGWGMYACAGGPPLTPAFDAILGERGGRGLVFGTEPPPTVPDPGGAAMSRGGSETNAYGRAVVSAASGSYTGRCSSTSGLGGRVEEPPRYTLGLLQTPRSAADSTGDLSSGGAKPGSSSGAGLAASSSRVKLPVPGRGGGVRCGVTIFIRVFIPIPFSSVSSVCLLESSFGRSCTIGR